MVETVAEVAKVTCLFKVRILRASPAQNQQDAKDHTSFI